MFMTASTILPRASTADIDPKAWAFPLSDRTNSLYSFLDFGTFDNTRRFAIFEEDRSFAVGFALEFSVAALSDQSENIVEAIIQMCPEGSILQFCTLNTPIDSGFLDAWRTARSKSDAFPRVTEAVDGLHARFSDTEHNLSGTFGGLTDGRRTRQFVFVWAPANLRDYPLAQRDAFVDLVEQVRDSMASLLKQLTGSEVNLMARENIRQVLAHLTLPEEGFTASRTAGAADDALVSRDTVRLPSREAARDVIVTPLTVDQPPLSMTQALASATLGENSNRPLEFPPYWAYTTVHLMGRGKSVAWLSGKLASIRASTRMMSTLNAPGMRTRLHATERLFTETERGRSLVRVYSGINLYTGASNQRRASEQVRHHFRALGFRLSPETLLTTPAFIASLPFQYRPENDRRGKGLQRASMMHSLNAATLVPLLSRESGSPHAGGVLATTPRGEAAILDMWASTDTSHNFLVLGSLEKGGASIMAELAGDALSRGGSVCVLDVHGEFREIAELTGTRSLKFSPDNPVSFNPFTGVDMQDADAVHSLVSLLANIGLRGGHPVDSAERLLLTIVKDIAAVHPDAPSLREVYNRLKADTSFLALELSIGLSPFVDGKYAGWFEGPCEVNLMAPVTVLDFSALQDLPGELRTQSGKLVTVLAQCALAQRTSRLYSALGSLCGNNPSHLTLVGATEFLNELQGDALQSILRWQRKVNSAIGFVCRNASRQFLASTAGRVLLNNCGRRLLLTASSYEIDNVADELNLNEALRHRWRQLSPQREHVEVIVEHFGSAPHCGTFRIIPGGALPSLAPVRTETNASPRIFRPRHSLQDFENSSREAAAL
jgi:conjugal transfer ATP-binding protein TraC